MPNEQLNKDVKKYIKDINSYLICDFSTRNKFISDLKSDIDEYIENNSVTDFDSVYKYFGEPRDIATGFLENADTKKIKRKMNITKVVMAAVIIAILILAIYMTFIAIDAHNSFYGHDETFIGNAAYNIILFSNFGGVL